MVKGSRRLERASSRQIKAPNHRNTGAFRGFGNAEMAQKGRLGARLEFCHGLPGPGGQGWAHSPVALRTRWWEPKTQRASLFELVGVRRFRRAFSSFRLKCEFFWRIQSRSTRSVIEGKRASNETLNGNAWLTPCEW